jgi:hypothetical protein
LRVRHQETGISQMRVDLIDREPARRSWTRIGHRSHSRVQGKTARLMRPASPRPDQTRRRPRSTRSSARFPDLTADHPRPPRLYTTLIRPDERSRGARRRAQLTDPSQERREQLARDRHLRQLECHRPGVLHHLRADLDQCWFQSSVAPFLRAIWRPARSRLDRRSGRFARFESGWAAWVSCRPWGCAIYR